MLLPTPPPQLLQFLGEPGAFDQQPAVGGDRHSSRHLHEDQVCHLCEIRLVGLVLSECLSLVCRLCFPEFHLRHH